MMPDVVSGNSDVLGGGGSSGGGDPTIVASTLAGLNAGLPVDGQPGLIRLGTWPNPSWEFRYNSAIAKWVSEPMVTVIQADAWAMDLGNRTGTQLLDWSEINNAVPFGKSAAFLVGSHDLSATNFNPGTATGVITVDSTVSTHSFPFQASSAASPYLQIRDNFLSYTAKTGTTFTGCAVVQGARGTIPTDVDVVQGYVGGYGYVSTPVDYASAMYAAGFTLQERLESLMNSAVGEAKITQAPYWFQFNAGDGTQPKAIPPTGGMGVSASVISPSSSGGIQGGERSFYVVRNGWSDWPLAAPTKEFLMPMMVGKMEAGATLTGSTLDTKLSMRWVG
jgi:hypothetical protein